MAIYLLFKKCQLFDPNGRMCPEIRQLNQDILLRQRHKTIRLKLRMSVVLTNIPKSRLCLNQPFLDR